jgi:Adenylate and Guanylate cyclase catalytic domain
VMSRYFDEMESVIERDAVMAVFGIPQLHEDDALRAVRAAAAMRERLAVLNDELEQDRGVRLSIRTGVNTGEVVAGDVSAGQKLVTGNAVNIAARLEQSARPGEVLIGADTRRLVHEAVRVEAVAPLRLKGKTERVSPRDRTETRLRSGPTERRQGRTRRQRRAQALVLRPRRDWCAGSLSEAPQALREVGLPRIETKKQFLPHLLIREEDIGLFGVDL